MAELVSVVVVIPAKGMAKVVSAAAVVVAEVVSAVVVTEVASTVAEGKVYQLLLLTHIVTTTKSKASPPVQIINYTRNTKLRSYSYSCYYLLFVGII